MNKWQRMTEWPLTVLALVFLLAYSWEVLARTHVSQCETTINVIWIVFIIDYVVSISLAHDRKTWFKNNLLLLISIMLPIFRPLRLLRLVAVLNVLNRTSGMAVRGRITLYVCSSVILLIYVGSLAELDVERNAPGTTITDFGKAIWWAFVTTTTGRLWRHVAGDMARQVHRRGSYDRRHRPDQRHHRNARVMDRRPGER